MKEKHNIMPALQAAAKAITTIPAYPESLAHQLRRHLNDHGLDVISTNAPVMQGWQPIETAPLGSHADPSTYFIGGRVDGARVNTATCYRTDQGAFEWFGGGMTPTHWMPLPTPPQGET